MTLITSPIIGQRFSRLVVIGTAPSNASRKRRVLCRCDCGSEKVILWSNVKRGFSKSCGCWAIERTRQMGLANRTHGMKRTYEFQIWSGIKYRCLNPSSRQYAAYGGRGIKICARWRRSFEAFYADMGPRPSMRHTVDRMNNDGPYSPENCRWASKREQSNNTRTNRRLTFRGETKTISQWARALKIGDSTLRERIRYGWSTEQAFTQSVRHYDRH